MTSGRHEVLKAWIATILWLIAIRREGMHVSGWQFFKAGMLIMPASLMLAVGGALLFGGH